MGTDSAPTDVEWEVVSRAGQEDRFPRMRTIEAARRYVEADLAITVLEPEDDTQAFRTYRNYIGAYALIVRELYGEIPYARARQVVASLPDIARLRRRELAGLERRRAARELRGAWACEIAMSPASQIRADDVPELAMISNHTAGLHAHYALYKVGRALLAAMHVSPLPERHETYLDAIDLQLIKRALLPTPWTARCDKGKAPRSSSEGKHVFLDLPERTMPCSNLWVADVDTMWSLVATALKTTRDRSRAFQEQLDGWRRQNRSKRARQAGPSVRKRWVPYEVQDAMYTALRPTNFFDLVYRLRRRTSYLDDDSFLSNQIGLSDALGFNRDILLLTRLTLTVFEELIARAAGPDFIEETKAEFARRTSPTLVAWTFGGRDGSGASSS